MRKVEPFPVEILKKHLDSPKREMKWLSDALIVGLCLRFTWRTETLKCIKVSNIELIQKERKEAFKISIFKSKTNQKGEEKVYILDQSKFKNYCLVTLLKSYLKSEDWALNKNSFLFINNSGNQVTPAFVSKILNQMAAASKMNKKFSSKSLRIGALEWMVRSGFTFETIRAFGWAENSPALSAYIRVSNAAETGATDKMFTF
jgi:hypothetical protein